MDKKIDIHMDMMQRECSRDDLTHFSLKLLDNFLQSEMEQEECKATAAVKDGENRTQLWNPEKKANKIF